MTIVESAKSARAPWFSLDAELEVNDFERLPQQKIDVCLMCELCASSCDKCDGNGNLKGKVGRPKIQIDTALLREMMQLKKCNAEMCNALKCSRDTLIRAKKELVTEGTL